MIAERDAQFFNFYLNGSVREGLRFHQGLYGKVYGFTHADRDAAFNLAIELGEMGSQAMVTVSRDSYQVWVELRSFECVQRSAMSQLILSTVPVTQPKQSRLALPRDQVNLCCSTAAA